MILVNIKDQKPEKKANHCQANQDRECEPAAGYWGYLGDPGFDTDRHLQTDCVVETTSPK